MPAVRLRILTVLALLSVLMAAWAAAPAMGASPLTGPSGWPLSGSPAVLTTFQPPSTPYGPGHRGVDLAADRGSAVLAAAGGRVTFAGRVGGRGVVVVSHGALRTTYEPVSARVRVGQPVSFGERLGSLSAGAHCGATSCLHWGLRRGDTYLDPLSLVSASLVGTGEVRLLPESARAVAQERATARVAAALAALRSSTGPGAGHGFAHPVSGSITSGFGRRFHPILKVWKLHDGTDFGAACGSPIRAPYAGRVTRAVHSSAYGNRLFLDHGTVNGRHVVTGYNHAQRYVVHAGARVSRGQVLGYVGATGYATGCHLHLMAWLDSRLTDPMQWF
jgi:murein DD-endopeptidase MepM/ murein hydrolase activator NlpD